MTSVASVIASGHQQGDLKHTLFYLAVAQKMDSERVQDFRQRLQYDMWMQMLIS